MLLLSTTAAAQDIHEHSAFVNDSIDPMKEAILNEIVVTGITGTQRLRDASAPFSVVSPDDLLRTTGSNLIDAISRQPGLSQISTGSGISKPVIRGLGYNRVVVVDQGIRQESQQWGDEHGLEVASAAVHSVEILKGPASLMYGSDAIAGVMILHPEPVLDEGVMQVHVGSEYQSNQGLWENVVGFAGNVSSFVWNWHYTDKAAHAYRNDRDGYVPGSWFKERDLQGMLGISREWGHSWLRFTHVDFRPGIVEGERDEQTGELIFEDGNTPKGYGVQLPSQRVLHTKVVSDNAWQLGPGQLKAVVGYQRNFRREFEESLDEAELAMKLHTVNYDLKYQFQLPHDWRMAAGVGGMWQKNVNEGEEFLIPDYHLLDIGAFVTANRQLGRWHLSGGVRVDNRSLKTDALLEDDEPVFAALDKDFTGVTGSLGAVWNVNDALNLRVNWARGFRAPTVSELSANGVHEGSIQYELGNDQLKAEVSQQLDLGMDYTTHWVSLQAALFANRIENYIYLSKLAGVLTEGYQTYQYRQGDAQLVGGEVSIDLHPVNAFHFENSLSVVEARQLHRHDEGKYLPMIPAPRWNMDLRYNFKDFGRSHFRRSYLAFGMEYNFRQDHFYGVDDTETATPDYALLSLSAGVDLHLKGHNCIELSLICQNLLDKVYQSHLSRLKYADTNALTGRMGVAGMGRNICLKVNIPLDIHLYRD